MDAPKPSILIPFGRFCLRVVSLPLYSFVFCVAWSVIFYFERSTDTHCHVWNFLPSISAAIGNYQPQRFVWQLAITLHAVPRFIVATFYHKRYQSLIRQRWRWLAALATLLNVIENVALLGLTYFTSVDHYGECVKQIQGCLIILSLLLLQRRTNSSSLHSLPHRRRTCFSRTC